MNSWALLFLIITLALLIPVAYIAFSPPNIAKLKAQGNISGLIKALTYHGLTTEAADVRQRAALALGQLRVPVAIEPLIAVLNDSKEEKVVRKAAATALGHFNDPRTIVPLTTVAADDTIGKAAVRSLQQLGPAAAQPLSRAVRDSSPDVRQKAVTALSKIEDTWAIQPLIQALQDEDETIQEIAVDALVKFGSAAVVPLSNVADYAPPATRRLAARALGEIGNSSATYILTQSLEDENSRVRQAVAEALDKLKWQPPSDYERVMYWIARQQWDKCRKVGGTAVEPLANVLVRTAASDDRDEQVEQAIVRTLVQIKTPAVVPLIDLLDKATSSGRKVIAEALSQIGDKRAIGPLVNLLEIEKGDVRRTVVKALEQLNWEPDTRKTGAIYWVTKQEWEKCIEIGPPAEGPLVEVIADPDTSPDLRQVAAITLQQIGTPSSIDVLARYWIATRHWSKCVELGSAAIEPLLASLNVPEVRDQVIHTLGEIGDPAVIKPLLSLAAQDMSIKTQEEITMALVKIGAIEPLAVIIKDIIDPAPERVRSVIVAALGLMGDKRAVDPLIAAFHRSLYSESKIRNAAVVAMGQIADAKAVNLLIHVVQDSREKWSIRQSAIEALGSIGDARAVSPLNKILMNWLELGRIRQAAAQALGEIGHKSAIGALIDCLKDSGHGIADSAAASLVAITGEDFGLDEERWRRWWKTQALKGNL